MPQLHCLTCSDARLGKFPMEKKGMIMGLGLYFFFCAFAMSILTAFWIINTPRDIAWIVALAWLFFIVCTIVVVVFILTMLLNLNRSIKERSKLLPTVLKGTLLGSSIMHVLNGRDEIYPYNHGSKMQLRFEVIELAMNQTNTDE